ncbi:MAG TPA: hypothetical protein PL033_04725 [Candidatus Brocadiia bacterium]|nr:hypothetical protein [Candidatus Brocadiia bacterium]
MNKKALGRVWLRAGLRCFCFVFADLAPAYRPERSGSRRPRFSSSKRFP